MNGDEEDGNGRGRPKSETYHQEVFEYSSSHHPSLHFFFFFLDLISIEIQPTFGEFSSSRIDLSAVGDSAEETRRQVGRCMYPHQGMRRERE